MNIDNLVRENIRNLRPYSSARSEFQGNAEVFLDANENPYNGPYNRYPDPLQRKVKEKIAGIKGVDPERIMLGNGSDEPIDLIVRIFCEPGKDNIVTIDPSYGMYSVVAQINNVEIRQILLNEDFDFKADDLLKHTDQQSKVIFLCSPNNPNGSTLDHDEIISTLKQFQGIVVIDEAYIDFSSQPSFLNELKNFPNLIVLQTFSKAWGSAGIRLGMAFSSKKIIDLMNNVKYPYNINSLTQEHALQMLENYTQMKEWVKNILEEREILRKKLIDLPCVLKVYPSDSNYLLTKVTDANKIYQFLVDKGIIVRNRDKISLCMGCIRITIGSKEENEKLFQALTQY